jgi:natural resistance-associated macrophage protein
MSMAYLDPGNLTSDLQQGAYTQYQLIWVLWWSTIVGWVLQMLSARLGIVTGKNLAQHCKEGYPPWASKGIFFQMELAVIGCDIHEVLGSAIALRVLFGSSLVVGCLITAVTTFGLLGVQKYGGVQVLEARLEAAFAVFIGIMGVCFCWNWALSGDDGALFMTGWVLVILCCANRPRLSGVWASSVPDRQPRPLQPTQGRSSSVGSLTSTFQCGQS